jgi:hypothetical protein
MAYGRQVFQSPPDRRDEAQAARRLLVADSAAARSDHLAIAAAFSAWNHARLKDGRQAAYQVIIFPGSIFTCESGQHSLLLISDAAAAAYSQCALMDTGEDLLLLRKPLASILAVLVQVASQMFVSDAAMEATLQGRAEYAGILADLGFLSREYAQSFNNAEAAGKLDPAFDEFSGNARIIKAAICAGAVLVVLLAWLWSVIVIMLFSSLFRMRLTATKSMSHAQGLFPLSSFDASSHFAYFGRLLPQCCACGASAGCLQESAGRGHGGRQ